jgi:Uma2 family endonuclease
MASAAPIPAPMPPGGADPDQRVILQGLDWWKFEAMLAIRGDRSGVRLTYLEGQLEIMSPSQTHERIKTTLGRLLEAYADHLGLVLEGYGSMTMRNAPALRGIEPDECYALGAPKASPDLAVEVIWTSGGLDKLDVYRKLGVTEVWIWEDGRLLLHSLRDDRYTPITRSGLLPDLDIGLLEPCLACETQTEAVRTFRQGLSPRGTP